MKRTEAKTAYPSGLTTFSEGLNSNEPPSYVLTDCKHLEGKYECTQMCESVWFKIWNATAAEEFVQVCDKAFIGKYADVMWEEWK